MSDFKKAILDAIKSKLPSAKVSIEEFGESPETPDVSRSKIQVRVHQVEMDLHVGENLTVYLQGHPIRILRYLPLLASADVQKFVADCIDGMNEDLLKSELPLVREYAKKYLGQEKKIERHPRAIYISYDNFRIIVSPVTIFMVNSSGRVVQAFEYPGNLGLENIFNIFASQKEQL